MQIDDGSLSFSSDVKKYRVSLNKDDAYAVKEILLSPNRRVVSELFDRYRLLLHQLENVGVLKFERECISSLPRSGMECYFDAIVPGYEKALADLSNATVAIIGLGGVGSIVLQHLVGAGVGSLILVDHDDVSASNLERQFIYRANDIGSRKIDVAGSYVKARNERASVHKIPRFFRHEQDFFDFFSGPIKVDFVVLAADQPPGLFATVAPQSLWCMEIPCIYGGVMSHSGFISPVLHKRFSSPPGSVADALGLKYSPGTNPQTPVAFNCYNTIVAAFIARQTIHFLTSSLHLTEFKNITFVDFSKLAFSRIVVPINSECDA